MKYILNYDTMSDFSDSFNVPPFTYWLEKTSYYKQNYVPSKAAPQPSQVVGPMEFKGMVSSPVPGVAYVKDSGMTFYNTSKFPFINLGEKLGYDYNNTKNFTWEELGITQEIYDGYRDEVNNFKPLENLNILEDIFPIELRTLSDDYVRIGFVYGTLEIYDDGTAIYKPNID